MNIKKVTLRSASTFSKKKTKTNTATGGTRKAREYPRRHLSPQKLYQFAVPCCYYRAEVDLTMNLLQMG